MNGSFESQIRALQERVGVLAARLAEPGSAVEEVARDAMAELATALEELFVAGEEIATQAEAILVGQVQTEMERSYFVSLFDTGPAAYVITDDAATIKVANRPASVLLGVDVAFLPGKPLSVFLDSDSQQVLFRLLNRTRRRPGVAARGDLELRTRSGTAVPITAVVTQAPGANESSPLEYRWLLDKGIAGRSFESLTPTEQRIAAASARLDSIVESASDAIVAIDDRQNIILFNRAASEMFGYDTADMVGRSLTSLLPDARDRHEQLVAGFAEEPSRWRRMGTRPTLQARRENGEEFPAEITVSKARVGSHWVFTAIIRDVTERDRALEELRLAEEFNRRVIATLDALVVVLDPEGRIVVFNGACERISGYSFADVAGRTLFDVLLPPGAEPHVRPVFDALKHGRRESTFENDWVTATGHRRRIRWSNTVLVDDDGAVTQVIGTGIDITHERELEQQLALTQRVEALGQLAGAVAHDFNNLLSIIQGHLELLCDSMELPPSASARTDAIAAGVKRGKALIANLTAISRHEHLPARVVHLNESTVALDRILSGILGPDVSLVLDLEASPDLVAIDPTQIEQVLLNLVLNACDAMTGGGQVTISTRSEPPTGTATDRVVLTVTDTGVGMDPTTRDRAMEPFFTTKGPGTGTGLGLASTKLIVEAAGGAIDVESTPGAGTTVSLWLPTAEPGRAPGAARADEEPDAADEGRGRTWVDATILVVDDEPELLAVVRDMLEGAGLRVLTAADAPAALALATQADAEVDLLVTDVVMPGKDGVALAEDLTTRLPHLAVVFMTGHADPEPPRRTRGEVRRILHKPFSRQALLTEVRDALAG